MEITLEEGNGQYAILREDRIKKGTMDILRRQTLDWVYQEEINHYSVNSSIIYICELFMSKYEP